MWSIMAVGMRGGWSPASVARKQREMDTGVPFIFSCLYSLGL